MADGGRQSAKRRRRDHPSEKGSAAGAPSGGEEPGPTGGAEVESGGETKAKLVHFDGHPAFTLKDLKAASKVVLGRSTYGTLRRAALDDGNQVAVRRLPWTHISSRITSKDFEAGVNRLGKIRHPNLLPLRAYHFSLTDQSKFLVFDYMPRGSLSAFLHGGLTFIMRGWDGTVLGPYNRVDWPTRLNIAIGITRGLHYLHTRENMVHGNLTSRNILLDDRTNAKIADYGLSHLMIPATNSNVKATARALGYRAPELSELKEPNSKTDVYSLGVIMLELLTGKSPRKAIDGLHLPEWVAGIAEEEWTDEVLDLDLTMDAAGTTANELLDTLTLALRCVDPSPDARPAVWQVLQQLEGIKPKFAGGRGAATTEGRDKPTDGCAHATGTATTAAPTTEDLANDGNLQARMPPPTNSCKDTVEELAKLTSKCDLEVGDQIPTPTPAERIIQGHSGNENSLVSLSTARPEGNNGASFPILNMDEAMAEDTTGKVMSTEGTYGTSGDPVASQLSSIDWGDIPIEVHLEVPTLPPLISSDPDSGYQRFFQTLYDLAYRSPPLPSNVLDVQLNRMIMGLHSLGYPLDTWLKAAALVLVLAEKREYIEHHVDKYFKVHVETQLAELTSAIGPFKEEVSMAQSDITTLEQKRKELDEAIAKLEDQLAVLKTKREGVVDSLTMSRDQLAAAEAKVQSMLVHTERLSQQYSAISDLRSELLRELPSLDEAFNSSFREILTKKF